MPRYTATSGRKCERLLPVTATSKYKRGLGCKRTNTSQTTMRPIGTHGKAERNRGGASASPLHIVAARVSKRKMQRRAEKRRLQRVQPSCASLRGARAAAHILRAASRPPLGAAPAAQARPLSGTPPPRSFGPARAAKPRVRLRPRAAVFWFPAVPRGALPYRGRRGAPRGAACARARPAPVLPRCLCPWRLRPRPGSRRASASRASQSAACALGGPALCVVASVLPLAALKLKRLRGRAEARPFVRSPKKKR